MYLMVRLKDGSKIQAKLPLVVADYDMACLTEVLNENNIPYTVIPLEGEEEEGE